MQSVYVQSERLPDRKTGEVEDYQTEKGESGERLPNRERESGGRLPDIERREWWETTRYRKKRGVGDYQTEKGERVGDYKTEKGESGGSLPDRERGVLGDCLLYTSPSPRDA